MPKRENSSKDLVKISSESNVKVKLILTFNSITFYSNLFNSFQASLAPKFLNLEHLKFIKNSVNFSVTSVVEFCGHELTGASF